AGVSVLVAGAGQIKIVNTEHLTQPMPYSEDY
ncbi:unnamed protein product, partial [marine sediment metagenome]